MKTLLKLIFFIILSLQVFAQNKTIYGMVSYHKLRPGHTISEAMAIEKEWKNIHQIRKNENYIINWIVLQPVNQMATPGIDFDYMTVNYSTDLDKIMEYPMESLNKIYTSDQINSIATRTNAVEYVAHTDIVQMEESIGSLENTKYLWFNFIKVLNNKTNEYVSFEKSMKKVHELRLQAGNITRWTFSKILLPYSESMKYHFATIDGVSSLEKFINTGYTEPLKKVFGSDIQAFINKASGLRSIQDSWVATIADKLN